MPNVTINLPITNTYRIAFAPERKPYWNGLLFTHKNVDFGAISEMDLKWRITYRIGVHTTLDSFSWRQERLFGVGTEPKFSRKM